MATTTIVQTEVPNYDEWRKGFDGNEQKRADAGIFLQGVYRDVDNGNKVTVISKARKLQRIFSRVRRGAQRWKNPAKLHM